MRPGAPWSAQRLGEFLVFLAEAPDEVTAIRVAIERAGSALEAEVAAVVGKDGVAGCVGFAVGQVPTSALVEAATGRRPVLDVPGAGRCRVAVAGLSLRDQGQLLVARSGEDDFTAEEFGLLRGMARALELTVERLRTLAAERLQAAKNDSLLASLQRRQRLLEQISEIQRAITRRSPQQEVLDSITEGAHRLLNDDVVALWMRDPDDPGALLLVSSRGLGGDLARRLWRVPITGAGTPGKALRGDQLVVAVPAGSTGHDAELVADGIVTTMAAPVHEAGAVIGSLEVASRHRTRVYSDSDQEVLRVFAEHVSLAVTDAKTHEAMRQAFHDPLTGLASRRLFGENLEHALAAAASDGSRVAVLFVDLDRFKNVNDSLGHAAGDRLLVGVAERVRSCTREGDTAARLGGDEFAVILVDLRDAGPAVLVARRIIAAVREPFVIDGKEVFVDASIGIAINSDAAGNGQTLLGNADLAMYEAKRNGKGRYEVFEPALRTAFVSRLDLEADLRHAVERDELVLHYQPILDLTSEEIVGVEALLRWQHPERGLIAPREFLSLAEETGLIIPMEIWAMTNACRQVAYWNRLRAMAPLTLSVNLSLRQIRRNELAAVVAEILRETALAPQRLILEITESLFLEGTDAIIANLRRLEQLRVRLAIDDFGAGYSSLAYLRRLPIHMIKIDKSFVDEMSSGPLATRLISAVVQLGRTLGLVTLAEGIEAQDQFNALRDVGCHLGQGFYFAKPVGASEIEPLLLGGRLPSAPLAQRRWRPGFSPFVRTEHS